MQAPALQTIEAANYSGGNSHSTLEKKRCAKIVKQLLGKK